MEFDPHVIRRGSALGDEGWSLFLVGDCQLDPDVWSDPPLSVPLRERISSSDVAIANLEAPIATGEPISKFGPALSTPESAPAILRASGFDVVSLANNHAMDYGADGLYRTIEACETAGLRTVGGGRTRAEAISPIEFSLGDTTFGVFGLCEREFGVASGSNPGTGWIRSPGIHERIERASEALDVVIVIAHGGIETVPLPPPSWRDHLASLVEAGADAIVGHHPHNPQGWELHEGAPIFYSLGNWLMHTADQPNWSCGLELRGADGEFSSASLVLVEQDDGRLAEIGSTRDATEHRTFLRDVSNLMNECDSYTGCWQEIAARVFSDRYEPRLREYGTGPFYSLLRHPTIAIDRWTREVTGESARRERDLTIQNYMQNGSHRDVVTTAIALRADETRDLRTPRVSETVDELFTHVRPPERMPLEENLRRVRTVVDRLT